MESFPLVDIGWASYQIDLEGHIYLARCPLTLLPHISSPSLAFPVFLPFYLTLHSTKFTLSLFYFFILLITASCLSHIVSLNKILLIPVVQQIFYTPKSSSSSYNKLHRLDKIPSYTIYYNFHESYSKRKVIKIIIKKISI